MKVSIITINYNDAEGLKNTIQSIISHKRADFEYLVIDGGSTNESIDIIKQYSDKIDYWVSEPDKGIYNAMNKGIKKASGEYILFINSGDTIQSDIRFTEVISQITGEDIIYYNLEISDISNKSSYIKEYPDYLDFKYFAEDTLPHTGSFIKKKVLIEYGYYSEEMKIVADWAFFMDAVCLQNCTYKYVNSVFSTFYTGGISSDWNNRQLLWDERNKHIESKYKIYYSVYKQWIENKQELYKLKTSVSVRFIKKIGFLKWLKL